MAELAGQVAVLTGASRGIGAQLYRLLLAEGASVVLAAREPEPLARLCAEAPPGRALAVPTDVREWEQVERLFGAAVDAYGRVDMLINNAGVAHFGAFAEATPEQIAWQVNVNLLGAMYCCRACLPLMLSRRSGQILNMASLLGVHAKRDSGAYSASKFGLLGLTESLSLEAGPRGIRVMALCPGMVNTEFSNLPPSVKQDGMDPGTVAKVALQMLTAPADVVVERVLLPARRRIR